MTISVCVTVSWSRALGLFLGAHRQCRKIGDHSPDQPTRDRHLLTYGARLFRTPAAGKFDLDIDVARQTGRARVTTADADRIDLPETAGFVHAEIGRKMGGH